MNCAISGSGQNIDWNNPPSSENDFKGLDGFTKVYASACHVIRQMKYGKDVCTAIAPMREAVDKIFPSLRSY